MQFDGYLTMSACSDKFITTLSVYGNGTDADGSPVVMGVLGEATCWPAAACSCHATWASGGPQPCCPMSLMGPCGASITGWYHTNVLHKPAERPNPAAL